MSWLLLLLYLVPVFTVVYLLDAYEREPLSLVVGALLWGAVAATSPAWPITTGGRSSPDSSGPTSPLAGRPP